MIKVSCWAPRPELKNLVPFLWVDAQTNAEIEAERVSIALKERAPGDRVIFFWNPFLGPDNSLEEIPKRIVNGYRFFSTFYENFFWKLHLLKAPKIDRIVLDFEGGISVWANISLLTDTARIEYMQTLYNDPQVVAKMNADMRSHHPQDFLTNSAAYQAWNFWTTPMMMNAMKQALVTPCLNSLGYLPKISNYGDVHPKFPISDLNGWLFQDAGVSIESAPSIYLAIHGNKRQNRATLPRWNAFIDALNYVRSCLQKGPCVPWVSYPAYQGDYVEETKPWLWIRMIEHLAASGIKEVLYWNPSQGNVSDRDPNEALASSIFCQTIPSSSIPILPEIPLDALEIQTGMIKTTYEDYLKNGV